MCVNVLTGHVVLKCPPPKSLMLTLTGFVRSFISRKAYLLCLCTCEWQRGRCVKVTIWVKFGNGPVGGRVRRPSFYRLHPLPAFPTATWKICMLFHQPPKQRPFQWCMPGRPLRKSPGLWNLKQKETEPDSFCRGHRSLTDPLDVSHHLLVKSPQFSHRLQLFFDPLLRRKH